MKQEGHITIYNLNLTPQTPVHIGSGTLYHKKEYLYEDGQVSIVDQQKFLAYIAVTETLTEAYTNFMLHSDMTLLEFCCMNGILEAQRKEFVQYTVDSKDALVPDKPLENIQAFIRDAHQCPYIPGSSLKGALVTILLMYLLKNEDKLSKPVDRRLLKIWADDTLVRLLHLDGAKKANPVNSVLRGLSLSDSAPLSKDCLTLAGKFDLRVDGSCNRINLVRECVKPATPIHLHISIDETLTRGIITADILNKAIDYYGKYYQETYLSRFTLPFGAAAESLDQCIILGGGSGYFAKNILYPAFSYEDALSMVADYMYNAFYDMRSKRDIHHHGDDKAVSKISPHMLKYTSFGGRLCHMGICKVDIS